MPFNIPKSCLIDQSIPLPMLKQKAHCTADEFDKIFSRVITVKEKYRMLPSVFGQPRYEDSTKVYTEIHIIEVCVASTSRLDAVARCIFHAIPYPLVLVFLWNEKVCFSAALERENLLDEMANKLFPPVYTYWLPPPAMWDFSIQPPDISSLSAVSHATIKYLYMQLYRFICEYGTNVFEDELYACTNHVQKIEYLNMCEGESDYFINEFDERVI